jgi:5-methylcytosine-specific restriction endonuclease McrA
LQNGTQFSFRNRTSRIDSIGCGRRVSGISPITQTDLAAIDEKIGFKQSKIKKWLNRFPSKLKKLILASSHGYCEYCWSPSEYTPAIYHFDHILPVVNGGKSLFLNLAYSCNACNSYKSDKIHALDSVTQQIARFIIRERIYEPTIFSGAMIF